MENSMVELDTNVKVVTNNSKPSFKIQDHLSQQSMLWFLKKDNW
jgi:hypothetical protein